MNIDASLVSRLVAEQFPEWAGLPIRPVVPGGWDNRTFRLGEELSVRLPSAERYAAQVDKEHRWLPRLAPHLPLAIPVPLAKGAPAHGYPWHWSVYRWLEGESAATGRIGDPSRFAAALAHFLADLQGVEPAGGPAPGRHNFFRGGPLSVYDAETREALVVLRRGVEAKRAAAVWEAALEARWSGTPVWLHGDFCADNLLVTSGEPCAVIDFGGLAVGDPACDLTLAWTLLAGESRKVFRAAVAADDALWARARGWALWKALITIAGSSDAEGPQVERARNVLAAVLADA